MSKIIDIRPEEQKEKTSVFCPFCMELMKTVDPMEHAGDKPLPPVVISKEPCDKCIEYMKDGVIILGGEFDDNDVLIGRNREFIVVSDEQFLSLFDIAREEFDKIKHKVFVFPSEHIVEVFGKGESQDENNEQT